MRARLALDALARARAAATCASPMAQALAKSVNRVVSTTVAKTGTVVAPSLPTSSIRALVGAAIVVALLVARLTFFVPHGYATGHNAVEPIAISTVAHGIVTHLHYYVLAMEPLKFVPKLFGYESTVIVAALIVASLIVGFAAYRADAATLPMRRLKSLLVLGGVVLFAGMAPYVAAGRPPVWTGFYARLAVMSQFGVFILGAAALAALRSSALAIGRRS